VFIQCIVARVSSNVWACGSRLASPKNRLRERPSASLSPTRPWMASGLLFEDHSSITTGPSEYASDRYVVNTEYMALTANLDAP
jgi:hypothetical protein